MTNTAWSLLLLLSLLATGSAISHDKHKLLAELQAEQNELEEGHDDHGRELWWWITSKDRKAGEVCGKRNTCARGLSCSEVTFGKRCSLRTNCLEQEIQQFEAENDLQMFKDEILQEAGFSEREIIEAGAAANSEEGGGLDQILRNPAIRSFITAMNRQLDRFDRVQDIVERCSSFSEEISTPEEIPATPEQQLQDDIVNEQVTTPTVSPSGSPSRSLEPSVSPSLSVAPSQAPSKLPTKAPSAAPSSKPSLSPQRTFYDGFSIEGGAFFEGSLTFFWQRRSGMDFPPVFVKGCLGVGAGVGAEIAFVNIIAETDDPSEVQCLSTMYDVKVTVGVGAGYGIGVCMLTDPTFVYQEIKWGAGLSLSASMFSVCDGAQIAQGYDDGRISSSDDRRGRDEDVAAARGRDVDVDSTSSSEDDSERGRRNDGV